MATVIDHLLVELDLDPKAFDEGKKKAAEAFLSIKQKAEQSAKDVNEPLDKISRGFSLVSGKIAAFATLIIGGVGLTKFAEDLTKAGVAIGNLSTVTGISTETLSKWQGMAERAGSSAQSITTAIASINKEATSFASGRGAPALMATINGLNKAGGNINPFDKNNQIRPATDLLLEINDTIKKLKLSRQETVGVLGNLPGMDDSVIAMLMTKDLRAMLKDQENIYKITQKDVEVSNQLNEAWMRLSQTAASFGRAILISLVPGLKTALDAASSLVQKLSEEQSLRNKNPIKPHELPGGIGGGEYPLEQADIPKNARPRMFQGSSLGSDRSGNFKLVSASGTQAQEALNATPEQWDAFRRGMAKIESSGGNYGLMGGAGKKYAGAYQFNQEEIASTAKRLGEPRPSTGQFLSDPAMQERFFNNLTAHNHGLMMRNPKYAAMTTEQKLGLLGYAHNQGVGGANKFLRTGVTGHDAFGTPGAKYISTIQQELDRTKNNAPVPWLSNPRMLRAPRYNQTLSSTQNHSTSETNVHSLIINGASKTITDDAYGLGVDVTPALERGTRMNQITDGPQ